jgi:hypothetical protein
MPATIQIRILSSHLLYRNLEIKMYKFVISFVVLYGCEIGSLALKEKDRLRLSEN